MRKAVAIAAAFLCSGVSFVVYVFQLFLYKLRVNLSGADVGMTEHFLNGAEVCAVFKKMRRKGMAKSMGSNWLFYTGLDLIGLDQLPEALT